MQRKTLNRPVTFKGIGLHGGQNVSLTLAPAESGQGLVFIRTDVEADRAIVPADYALVSDTKLCTRLTNTAGTSIGTVEHVMAALAGAGVTDARLLIDGPEVPIMDGSSRPFTLGIARVGLRTLSDPLRGVRVLRPVRVEQDGKSAALIPADRFSIAFDIDFPDPAIGRQSLTCDLYNGAFAAHLADCRTFGRLAEVEGLRRMGLARGGSLDNAIVVDGGRVLNPEGLRRPDEFVRHKILDAVGDLALAGAPVIARYEGVRAGHEMTNLLLRQLFSERGAWEWTDVRPDQWFDGSLPVPQDTAEGATAVAS